MGIVKCTIHGQQGFYEMCEHIWNDLENGINPNMKTMPVLHTQVCEDCYNLLNMQEIEGITIDDILELPEAEGLELEEKVTAKYNKIERRINCIECINQTILNNARKNNHS
jgi:hypothetical protein